LTCSLLIHQIDSSSRVLREVLTLLANNDYVGVLSMYLDVISTTAHKKTWNNLLCLGLALCVLCICGITACSDYRLPARSNVDSDEWQLVQDRILLDISERPVYADFISGPKSLEIIHFATESPYFVIALAAKTSKSWYLFRFAGAISRNEVQFSKIGKWMDTIQDVKLRKLEEHLARHDFSTLYEGAFGSPEEINWDDVRECFHSCSDIGPLHCDCSMAYLSYKDSPVPIISDTTITEATLGLTVALGLPRHLEKRFSRYIGEQIRVRGYIGDGTIHFPWFGTEVNIAVDEETQQYSIVGYIGTHGISYRLSPSLGAVLDSLALNPDAKISIIPQDHTKPSIKQWLHPGSLSKAYQFYVAGPDDDTLYNEQSMK
jgi:hypothetical protein